jgi:hypothetical protein
MASKVDICNLALGRISAPVINAITEKSKEAKMCALYYDTVRKAVLRQHNWNFATEVVALALTAVEDAEWDFVYQMPVDCVKVIEIVKPSTAKIPYKIRGRYLLTDQESANLKYVKNIEDTTLFDDQFIAAFSYRLAADLAMPLTGKQAFQNQMYQLYIAELNSARSIDASESQEEPDDAIIDSRN